jgi:hypothetical protein
MATKFVICGDLNVPHIDWTGSKHVGGISQSTVNKLILDSGFTQVVTQAARKNNILDVLITRHPNLYADIQIINGLSDHSIVVATLNNEVVFGYFRIEL